MHMHDTDDTPHARVAADLEILSELLKRQMSVWHVFRNGLIYGAGFVVGSTIVTAVVVTILINLFSGTELGDMLSWFARER